MKQRLCNPSGHLTWHWAAGRAGVEMKKASYKGEALRILVGFVCETRSDPIRSRETLLSRHKVIVKCGWIFALGPNRSGYPLLNSTCLLVNQRRDTRYLSKSIVTSKNCPLQWLQEVRRPITLSMQMSLNGRHLIVPALCRHFILMCHITPSRLGTDRKLDCLESTADRNYLHS